MATRTVARAVLVTLVALLPACGNEPVPEPSPTPAVTTTPSEPAEESPVDETSFVLFPETEKLEVVLLCQADGPDGPILNGELENGGSIQLRKVPEGILHASALPSPEADPVGTNVPSDTSFTEEGGFVTGTSLMWLQGTENNISVDYHLRWDDTVPPCDL